MVETYLLKLQLWTAMVEEVARFTAAAGRPLLNLGPSSFSTRLADTAAGLPALWTTAVNLTDAGDAVPIQLPQGDTKHYFCLPGRSVATSMYQPASVTRGSVPGFGQLYLSGSTETPAGKVFDGILTVADPIRPTARDVLRVRVPVVGRRVDLYVKVLPDQNPSPSQLKVRSVPDDRLKPVSGAIEALIGVPLHEVAFEHYPLFGSAADIYSLAVLGVDLLLTPPDGNHAERFRDVLVLAGRCREARSGANPPPPLVDRVAAVVAAHPRRPGRPGPAVAGGLARRPATGPAGRHPPSCGGPRSRCCCGCSPATAPTACWPTSATPCPRRARRPPRWPARTMCCCPTCDGSPPAPAVCSSASGAATA